jgi:hypothetical protein
MVATGEVGGEPGALLEEAGAEPVKVSAADLEVQAGISGVNLTLVELPQYLLEKRVGQAFGDLLFLITIRQTNRRPPPNHLSLFELPPVSFCSRADNRIFPSEPV